MGYNFKDKDLPLILVPDIFGSVGEIIFKDTGKWKFGLYKYPYNFSIKLLKEIGYNLDKNLFIAYYDWRKEGFLITFKYLKPLIDKVKRETGSDKVNLICHGFGGLLARTYIQSNYYSNDVNKLILVSTPNTGIADSYSFWKYGTFPKDKFNLSNWRRIYMNSYLDLFKEDEKFVKRIQKEFPALKNITPSLEYGDFIVSNQNRNSINFKNQEEVDVKNYFLNNLNRNREKLYKSGVNIISIAGTGKSTLQYLQEDELKGEIIGGIETKDGDGVVTVKSALYLDGEKYLIYIDEDNFLDASFEIIAEKI